MRVERPLPPDLESRLATLAREWSDDPDIAAVYLFGSRAAGKPGPRSDVDLAVVLRDDFDTDARWRKRLDLLADASRRLGTDGVDLVVLEDAPTVLAHRVLARGRMLCEPRPRRRAAVAESAMRRYLDEAHLRAVLDEGLAQRVREGRFGR
jgi:predicted nucleotidyltransferase